MPGVLESFRIEAYLGWLQALQRPIVPATDERPAEAPWLALQHDIDLSLEWAVRMAQLESELGFHACYYVQVGSPFYDVASPEGRWALHQIRTAGHEIGLHYDWRSYDKARITLAAGLEADLGILSIASGHRVRVVCAHKPLRNGTPHGVDLPTPQVAGEVYVSDSSRGFRDAGIHALENPPEKLRFNAHPAWWRQGGRRHILARAISNAQVRISAELSDWDGMDMHPNALEHDARQHG